MSLALIAAVMVFAAGLNYRYIVGAALALLPLVAVAGHAEPTTGGAALLAFLDPWDDPLGHRLSDHPVADRRRHRRRLRDAA